MQLYNSKEADQISFFFVFGQKNDDFLVFGVLFFCQKLLMYFQFYFIFWPNNPRKLR